MTIEYNGTNPIFTAIGDTNTVRDVSITNSLHYALIEPLTKATLAPLGAVTVVRVTGDFAYSQIIKNIAQLNTLYRQTVLSQSSVVV